MDLIQRILADRLIVKLNGEVYYVEHATAAQRWEADYLYQDILYELSFSEWISEKDTERILIRYGLWHQEYADRLKLLEKTLEDLKVKLFENFLRVEKRKQIKVAIEKAKKQLVHLQHRKSSLDYVTLEYYAKTLKLQYVTALCIKDQKNKHIYTPTSFWFSDSFILLGVLKYMGENQISHETIRKMARTEPWRSYWSIGKERLFHLDSLTDEQRTLAVYSKMYDSAYGHPECPIEDIFEDDDAFDGWLITQDRKRKKEMAEKNVDPLIGKKQRRAGEIFVPVSSQEEASEIYKLNDIQTRMEQQKRREVLDKKGTVEEQYFPDVQMKLRQQAHREFIARVKGKR